MSASNIDINISETKEDIFFSRIIIVLILILLFTIIYFVVLRKKKEAKRNLVTICGANNSGKTAFFYSVLYNI